MGFFSWNCKGCGESIKAPYDIPKELAWQNNVVFYRFVVRHSTNDSTLDGGLYSLDELTYGSYDGYGRVNTDNGEFKLYDPVCIWHQDCFDKDLDLEPSQDYSTRASDQGYFYDRSGD